MTDKEIESVLSDERLNDIKNIFEQHGLNVQIGG